MLHTQNIMIINPSTDLSNISEVGLKKYIVLLGFLHNSIGFLLSETVTNWKTLKKYMSVRTL